MTKLTAAQTKHLKALTGEFQCIKDIRNLHGFCNANTLKVLRREGLVEFMNTGTPTAYVAETDHHYRLTAAGVEAV